MTETRRTACNRDCPDACALLVELDDAGRAVRLRGDPADPITQGFLCERTSRFLDRQYDRSRFTTPLLRVGGSLRPVSWEHALDVAAAKLLHARGEFGAASILHYRSGGSLGILKNLADHLFEQFGPVTIKRGDICSGAGDWAQQNDFGGLGINDVFDLEHSATILIWGKNPHTSAVHLLPVLRDARVRGARIVGIDPVRTRASELCERFVQPRPGGDVALALGMARVIFERDWVHASAAERCDGLDAFRALAESRTLDDWAREADVPAAEIASLAELYATGGPANIQVGWGMGRRANGAECVRALDALCAITGNLGVRGGGVSFDAARSKSFALDFVRGLEVAPRSFREACLGRDIRSASEPPIRVAWITAGNPVAMLPDSLVVREALVHTDFVVVVDTHPTDTTDVADLVLPTLTLLEDSDLLGSYGHHWLRSSEPAVEPPGEARHELHILQGLAERLDLAHVLAGSIDDWKRRLLAKLAPAGVTLERLRAGDVRDPLRPEVLFEGGEVPRGRTALLSEPAAPPPETDAEWPLTLLAVSTPKAQASQWSVPLTPGPPEVRVHPSAAPGADGQERMLRSERASMRVRVVHDERVRPDVALMEKGGQLRDGRGVNALVSARETDNGGGACYYDERVRLE